MFSRIFQSFQNIFHSNESIIEIEQNEIHYRLNFKELIADIIHINDDINIQIVKIPYSINFKSKNFIIKSILNDSFSNNTKIKEIIFPENSEIEIFREKAFKNSTIERITIPSKVKIIEKLCFYNCKNLTTVNFSSNSELDLIEESAFEGTQIERITIPKNVIIIGDKCFKDCKNLKTVIFESNSEIRFFNESLFINSSIETITIPKSVTAIRRNCFSSCHKLEKLEFEDNSYIEIFEEKAFSESNLSKIKIPKTVKKILNKCFYHCTNLRTVVFEKDCNIDTIEFDCFSYTSIEEITIPRKVKTIEDGCFYFCKKLRKVDFEKDSELIYICDKSFLKSSIESIKIPSKVQKIGINAFSQCPNLETIEFDEDSELFSFPSFNTTQIKTISIPSKIEYFQRSWSCDLVNVTTVLISPKNTHLKYIDDEHKIIVLDNKEIVFACRDIKHAIIPSYITKIDQFAFANCVQLEKIEISEDSQLKIIGNHAFNDCQLIEYIFIPKNIKVIGTGVFKSCFKLKNVEFSKESNLLLIQKNAFESTVIEKFEFPSSLQVLIDRWYTSDCKIKHISIPPDNSFFKCLNYNDQELVICKSNNNSDVFDTLVFISLDGKCPEIPSYIKHINADVFIKSNIDTVLFKEDSQFSSFAPYGFMNSSIKSLLIPSHFKQMTTGLFMKCKNLRTVEFLGDEIILTEFMCFEDCNDLFLFSFPNAKKIKISKTSSILKKEKLTIFIKIRAEIIISEFL